MNVDPMAESLSSASLVNAGTLTKKTLHSHEMDALMDALSAAQNDPSPLTVDLSDVTYATPSGMVWLLAALRGIQRNRNRSGGSEGGSLRVIPPPPESARVRIHYWLKWMGAYDYLDREAIACDWAKPPTPPTEEQKLQSETLLTLTTLNSSADVAGAVGRVSGQVARLLHRHLEYDNSDVANLSMILSEACHNIIDHAGSDALGLVAAQVIRKPKQEPFVMIGIGDDGIGIRSSLSRAYPALAQGTDAQAISEALKRGVSGVSDADRGLGLWSIVDKIPRYRATLHMRSGAARIRIKANESGGIDTNAYASSSGIPGVMICLTLRKRIPPPT
jgi:anti-sigma regulatory factor (Ser/Thr protein kinase)